MELSKLETFATEARRELMRCVADKIAFALQENSPVRRQNPQAVAGLEEAIKNFGKESVVERTAYAWFNRFCALRYMDVNGYTDSGVVTPPMGGTIPGILSEARDGNFDEGLFATGIKDRVRNILSGATREDDPNSAAYRVLFIATCNSWQPKMPFLFEKLGDWTEILLPDDLLSANSILAKVRAALTAEACSDVEVVGWLYQFYVAEKKKAIEDGFGKNIKASAENIPAVTQLFTPLWIVKYLVQNSLGRLWLTLHPESGLKSIMEYYVPGDPEHPTPVPSGIERPEDIRVCDPCCGSAHMLTYAFDILYFIYEECGYSPAEIPGLILKYNLYGLELDPRAAALASFALVMKARSKYSRFLKNPTMPNICAIEAVRFGEGEIAPYMNRIGRDLFTQPLLKTLGQFDEADNFGSLIVPALETAADLEPIFKAKDPSGELFDADNPDFNWLTHDRIKKVLRQAAFLSPRYHVVVTNPPYLGAKYMNARLKKFAEEHYSTSKSDLFAMFIDRCLKLNVMSGFVGMITMQSWMFLSSFEDLRQRILSEKTLVAMSHLGAKAFDTIGGEVVSTTAFVIVNAHSRNYCGRYLRLIDGSCESDKEKACREHVDQETFYRASAEDFENIPGSPIAYWISPQAKSAFSLRKLDEVADPRTGFTTGDNDSFLRLWFEISAEKLGRKWFYLNKGGTYRKWYGNNEFVVDWEDDGKRIKAANGSTIRNPEYYFKEGVTWSKISSYNFSGRYSPSTHIFDAVGLVCFPKAGDYPNLYKLLAAFNAKTASFFLGVINPTLSFSTGPVGNLPIPNELPDTIEQIAKRGVEIAREDWDSFETSWDFTVLPILCQSSRVLSQAYASLREAWKDCCQELRTIEEENNKIFITAYGLQGEQSEKESWEDITLNCNPWNRYARCDITPVIGDDFPIDARNERLLKEDTARDLVSYAVGCMMGRYSLDKPGLILADQGATEADYYTKIGLDKTAAKFAVDEDGIIPILDNDWFQDDIVTRFKEFVKVAFGEEHFLENMTWIEDALGKDIRSYFTKDFYKDHLQRYQNRPIYWLFQSPKGAFRALVYMHRYKPDMVGGVLGYLRSLQTKIDNQLDVAMQVGADESKSASERVRANKDAVKFAKAKKELDEYEKNVLYPLSTERIEIDLDDGVKVNYRKFGSALRKVAALEAKGE